MDGALNDVLKRLSRDVRVPGFRPGKVPRKVLETRMGGATALLPIFASDVLHIGPAGLGLLRTAPGVGAAFGSVMQGNDRVTVIFFGDGSTEEGVFSEALNFAALKSLPEGLEALTDAYRHALASRQDAILAGDRAAVLNHSRTLVLLQQKANGGTSFGMAAPESPAEQLRRAAAA